MLPRDTQCHAVRRMLDDADVLFCCCLMYTDISYDKNALNHDKNETRWLYWYPTIAQKIIRTNAVSLKRGTKPRSA